MSVTYDKAKYHFESVEEQGLDQDQAYVHTAFYIRWLLDNAMFSDWFCEESVDLLKAYSNREITALDVYQHWDGCLIDDMLSDEGNAFSQIYFDFANGNY